MQSIIGYVRSGLVQMRVLFRLLMGIYLPVVALFLGIGILTQIVKHLTIPDLLRDVATLGKLPFYAGSVSQLGLLLWSAATTLCFFFYFAIKKLDSSRKAALNMLFYAGCLTGYLMLDDTFMIHEEIVSDYLQIVSEKVVILLIGLAMLGFLYFNWGEILKGEYSLMFLAYMFFGISIIFDAIPTDLYEEIYIFEKLEHLIEDGAKMAAIVTWVTFYARYGYFQIKSLIAEKQAAAN